MLNTHSRKTRLKYRKNATSVHHTLSVLERENKEYFFQIYDACLHNGISGPKFSDYAPSAP